MLPCAGFVRCASKKYMSYLHLQIIYFYKPFNIEFGKYIPCTQNTVLTAQWTVPCSYPTVKRNRSAMMHVNM